MEENKKDLVYNAYTFSFKNILTYFRPFIILGIYLILCAFLLIATILLVSVIFAVSLSKNLFSGALSIMAIIVGGSLLTAFLGIWDAFYSYFSLKIVDGNAQQTPQLPSLRQTIKIGIVMIIKVIIGIPAFMLFIIPGILWVIRSTYTNYVIIDDNASILKAFQQSFAITRGNGWLVFTSIFFGLILTASSTVAFLFTTPLISIATAYMYRQLLKDKQTNPAP